MSKELIPAEQVASNLEKVVIQGDLSSLSSEEKLTYHNEVCKTVGLNPLTKPFEYIRLNGKLTLYATRACTEQLRKLYGVAITDIVSAQEKELYIVRVSAKDKTGRVDMATGAVSTIGLQGDKLANQIMKAETKAKRRVTLSICGLGMLDETEIEDVHDAKPLDAPTYTEKLSMEEEEHQRLLEIHKTKELIRERIKKGEVFEYDLAVLKHLPNDEKKEIMDAINRHYAIMENKTVYSLKKIDELERHQTVETEVIEG